MFAHAAILPRMPVGGTLEVVTSDARDQGGDPACWLHMICDDCGAVLEDGVEHVCPRAGEDVAGQTGSTSTQPAPADERRIASSTD